MFIFFSACVILIIDQLSKLFILKNFHPGQSIPVIKGVFHISFVYNRGVAFGIFSKASNSTFIWISCVAIVFIICILIFYQQLFRKNRPMLVSFSLILSGAIGNLIDRIRLGFVVDFLDLRIWPVFNIADIAITSGTVLLLLQILQRKSRDY
jgi:signal peptidase II